MNLTASRAVLRIARRNVARSRWRSLLVVLLILLPVAGMAGGITYLRTTTPSPEAYATSMMGRANAIIYSAPRGTTTESLRGQLPAGTRLEPMSSWEGTLALPGRTMDAYVRALDLDGLAAGIMTVTAGRAPRQPAEVAVTAPLAAAAGLDAGASFELDGSGQVVVVGLIEAPDSLSSRTVLVHASHAEAGGQASGGPSWLLALPVDADIDQLQTTIGDLYTRDDFRHSAGDALVGMVGFGGLVLVETVLVASAAFAVSIRRRQRDLGMIAAIGGQRRHLAGTVLGDALVLGAIAVGGATLIGVGAVVGLAPWLDQLTDRRNPPVVIDVVALALAALLGLGAALAAAAVPAWTAARVPVLAALSGRRPPAAGARRLLGIGLALVCVAVALTAGAVSFVLAGGMTSATALMLLGGAVIGVLGIGATSPWLVERLEWMGRQLPVSARLALRDTARARSRSAPIVTAMLVSLAAAVAIMSAISSAAAQQEASWRPWLGTDQLMIAGDEALSAGPQVAREMDAVASAPLVTLLVSADGSERDLQVGYDSGGGAVTVIDDHQIRCQNECAFWGVGLGSEELLEALGAGAAIDAFRRGEVVILTQQPIPVREALVQIHAASGDAHVDDPNIPPGAVVFLPTHTEVVPATAVATGVPPMGGRIPGALLPPSVADRLGFVPLVEEGPDYGEYIVRLDRGVTETDVAHAAELLTNHPGTFASGSFPLVIDVGGGRLLILGLSLVLALTITAIAVALGEAESRADQRTLLAVGAEPHIRRRIAAARAGVLALLGALLAVPAGLLPVWGLMASQRSQLVVAVPETLAMVILLPLGAVIGALLLSRPIPSWSAFRDVSSG